MKPSIKIATNATLIIIAYVTVILFVFSYFFSSAMSIQEYLSLFLSAKNLYNEPEKVYYLISIAFFPIFIGIGGIIAFFIQKNLARIEHHSEKLRDYNHYLAHELKTPLAIIHSNLDVLKYEYNPDIIKKSQQELRSVTSIIDGLLHFSESLRVENEQMINLENFLMERLATYDKSERITLTNKAFNKSIKTDEILFSRIVLNLTENALKHGSDGKLQITITEDFLIFENAIEKCLDENELLRIQDRFQRGTTKESGLGLGLPMIKEIARALGLQMEIGCEKGFFWVRIPIS